MGTAAGSLDWVYYLLGGVGAVGGLLLLVWALFRDRARGRRRCPRCWYDMGGTAGLKCPECGREARSERKLGRTRRRWGWAPVAVALLVAGLAGAAAPFATTERLLHWMPTRVLAYAVPWIAELEPSWDLKYRQELMSRHLSVSQYNVLVRRIAEVFRGKDPRQSRWLFWHTLGKHSFGSDGDIIFGSRKFLSDTAEVRSDPYSVLSPGLGSVLAESLTIWWKGDSSFTGNYAAHELCYLAFLNSDACDWCLDRLFDEPTAWPLHFVDPRSCGGAAMKRLLQEFRGTDEERRSRAAACLLRFRPLMMATMPPKDPAVEWVGDEYPSVEALDAQIGPAADRLLALAKSERVDSLIAVRGIANTPEVFWRQVIQLEGITDSLPSEVQHDLLQTIKMFERSRQETKGDQVPH